MPRIEITREMVQRAAEVLKNFGFPGMGHDDRMGLARRMLLGSIALPASLMVEPEAGPRWRGYVTYWSAKGDILVEHDFEEIQDLQQIIEAGPDWNTIRDMTIVLRRRTTPLGDTVEEAAQR